MGLTFAAGLRWAGDLLFPRPCPGCDAPLPAGHGFEFCAACRESLPWIREPFCAVCGEAFRVAAPEDAARFHGRTCVRCREDTPRFTLARAAFRYAGPIRHAVHHLKFDGWKSLARGLAAMSVGAIRGTTALFDGVDVVTPVPLHRDRQRERGYNQAEVLARGMAAAIRKPVREEMLRRVRATPPQVGLDRPARLENLKGAFVVDPPGAAGLTVLLVDDVVTTGATVNACAGLLRTAGATEVRVASLARD